MPRLRNTATGATVNVDDDTAARLEGYEPAESDGDTPKRRTRSTGKTEN